MTDVERLIAVEEIKQLKARYYRCMDTKQWSGWEEVFTADATMDVSEEQPPGSTERMPIVKGRDNIIPFVSKVLEGVVTVHHGHMPEIEITSDTTARGIWSMEDKLQMARRQDDLARLRPLSRDLREGRRQMADQDPEADAPAP